MNSEVGCIMISREILTQPTSAFTRFDWPEEVASSDDNSSWRPYLCIASELACLRRTPRSCTTFWLLHMDITNRETAINVGLLGQVATQARYVLTSWGYNRQEEHQSLITFNTNICSIELKWDGKITKIWYDNEMRWIRITVWKGGD